MGSNKTQLNERRVRDWVESGREVKKILILEGPRIMNDLCLYLSLRKLAKKAGLSPTYLSQVATGKVVISPVSYLKLVDIQRGRE